MFVMGYLSFAKTAKFGLGKSIRSEHGGNNEKEEQLFQKKEFAHLQYGNCDISDWEGQLNTNNNNRALTGFWIKSSLTISPKEQVEVMERIFGENSDYSVP